jgi:hypothetical protein
MNGFSRMLVQAGIGRALVHAGQQIHGHPDHHLPVSQGEPTRLHDARGNNQAELSPGRIRSLCGGLVD